MSHLAVELTDIGPGHQALPELFGSVPHQVQAGLLEEEGQEAQVAVQILDTRRGEASKLTYCLSNNIAPTVKQQKQPGCMNCSPIFSTVNHTKNEKCNKNVLT